MPHHVHPMLAELTEKPFDDSNWLFELKWDGYRAIAEVNNGIVSLYSRNFNEFNEKYIPIVRELETYGSNMVLDGEVVVLDKQGKSSFQYLQNYQNSSSGNLRYVVFDIIYLNGYDLTSIPLIKRKAILKSVIKKGGLILYSDHILKAGISFFREARKKNLEGIMAKNSISPYRMGERSGEWLKVKTVLRQEAVIGGVTEPKGSRQHFGALLLGLYENGKFNYIGHMGGGFTNAKLKEMKAILDPLVTDKSPFEQKIKTNSPVKWLKPKLVCEVKFSEWTKDGIMRMPVFIGLREDKNPKDVGRENFKKYKNG